MLDHGIYIYIYICYVSPWLDLMCQKTQLRSWIVETVELKYNVYSFKPFSFLSSYLIKSHSAFLCVIRSCLHLEILACATQRQPLECLHTR